MKNFIQTLCIDDIHTDTIYVNEDITLSRYNRNKQSYYPQKPYKLTHAIISVCTSGSVDFKLSLQDHCVNTPAILTLMPGHIIENIKYSDNFDAYVIVLSKRFMDALNLPNWQQQYMSLYNTPVHPISEEIASYAKTIFATLHRAASKEDNPYRLQVMENIIKVFYYSGITEIQQVCNEATAYNNNLVERFIELVQDHYREERLIGFYANKLCITPKYLSKLVKEHTGRSAGEWIENHVILEARALLQSSDKTIQQIAVLLNFPNQSFFGKYFKRATGMSPKQYRHLK